VRVSFDTNILVYAADFNAGHRHPAAARLLELASRANCLLTLQTLCEFFNVATRKAKLAPAEVRGFVLDWREVFPIHIADESALDDAIQAVARHHLPFWDAMLWATVQQAGCDLLLTEDFQDRRRLGTVTFINPFDPVNAALLDRALAPGAK
jgi:predicted nucleic acid-binding protein